MDTPIVSVVTGASRGLGRAAALRFATMKEHRAVATARKPEDLASLTAKLEVGGHRIDTHALDVTDERSVTALRDWLAERYGRVDVLVNNAGIMIDRYTTRLAELPLETLRTTLETNLFGMLRVTQALLPLLHASRAGRIVNLSSGMGQLSEMEAGTPAYRISKTAVNALTRILAVELSDTPIKVNAVCPGWCRTDLGGHNATRSPEEGIDTVIWAATLPADGPTGGFFRDREQISW